MQEIRLKFRDKNYSIYFKNREMLQAFLLDFHINKNHIIWSEKYFCWEVV